MEKIACTISVRDLVAFSIPAGEGMGFSLSTPAREGIEGHQYMHALLKQQTEAAGSYEKERSVTLSFSHEQVTLQISGRLDGLLEINGHYSVCEIKTTEKPLVSELSDNPSHWAQCRCYAYLLACEKKLDKITLLLIYFHRTRKDYRSFDETLTFSQLEKFFHSLAFPYINHLIKQSQWQNIRNLSIQSLPFPHHEFRKGQRPMSVSVYRAIRDGRKQFIQAPTGIGKTVGSLFPAIKAIGEGLIDKIFYITARNTTQSIALDTYKAMAEKGLRLKTLQITAKEKVCLSSGSACTPEDCLYLEAYAENSRAVVSSLSKACDYFSRDVIYHAAMEHTLCPFELSLDLSLQSDLIVCDYNYVFDPRVYLKRFFQDKPDSRICLLIDEAHNLPDRAREMYSAEIKRSQFKWIYRLIKNELPEMASALKKARRAFLEYLRKLPLSWQEIGLPCAWSHPEPPESLIKPIENFLDLTEDIFNDESPYPFKDELITFFFELQHFIKIYDFFGENYTTFLLREKGEFTLRLYCLDPAPLLRKKMKDMHSTILFSATLSPSAYYKEVLGGDDTDGYHILPSPFPRNHLFVYIDDTVSTKSHSRKKTLPRVIQCIHDAVSAKTGNYMVFFPSFSYMRQAVSEYENQYPGDHLLVQETTMAEKEREDFLYRFTAFGESTLIGFAVMGGIFGEGIDLKGDCLSGAIIVGVGLPGICPEQDILCRYYQKKNGRGFDFAYTFPGFNKVRQAAGRVIRSDHDKGFIILLDDRFTTPLYRSILPAEWIPYGTPKDRNNLFLSLKDFWNPVTTPEDASSKKP